MKRTYITLDQLPEYHERNDFVPCCRYGNLEMERDEVGAIVNGDPTSITEGFFVSEVTVLERIFLKENHSES